MHFRDVPDILSYRISGWIIAIWYPIGTGYCYLGGAVLPVKDCSVLLVMCLLTVVVVYCLIELNTLFF
jgi:hypothetical protein